VPGPALAPRRSAGGRLVGGLALAVALVALLAALAPGLLSSLDPFGTETRDRSQPALLRSLQGLHEYRAATATLQQVVDVERDAKLLPAFLKGERTTALVTGTVDAGVDFSGLGPRALQVSPDRRAVTITLPPARLSPARVDLARTRVLDRDRGLLDRAGDLLGDGNPDAERQLLLVAQRKLDGAARSDPELLRMAQRNTTQMLERLARGLGYQRVTVRYRAPAV
jgi:hypothetical protein